MANGTGCSLHNEYDSSCPICKLFNLNDNDFQYLMAKLTSLDKGTLFQYLMANLPLLDEDMPTQDTHKEGQNSENEARDRKNIPFTPSKKKKIPFTRKEAGVLVLGVLKHGRGRWAMIKDEFFGNGSKRTRNDLRDKWKNLVRTATIRAHERRGAVIPEWLLEIVLNVEILEIIVDLIPPASHATV